MRALKQSVSAAPRRATSGICFRALAEVLLFERDRDLLSGTPPGQEDELRGYRVEVRRLDAVGTWNDPYPDEEQGAFALLLLEGTMSRRVVLGNRQSVELLAPGDVLRPWVEDGGAVFIPKITWCVHDPAVIAVLPDAFPRDVASCPRVMHVLADRMLMRSRWLALDLAISHHVGADGRLMLALWHLADRWGRVTPDGVKVELGGLTHELLGDIIGARRPSVSTALGELRERRLVEPLKGGGWMLLGGPPDPTEL